MIHIGNFEVLEEKRLIVPDTIVDGAWLDFLNNQEIIRIHLMFVNNDQEKDSGIKIHGKENHSEITLTNWKNSFGTCTSEPIKIAKSDDSRDIFVMIASTKISSVNIVDVQLMLR